MAESEDLCVEPAHAEVLPRAPEEPPYFPAPRKEASAIIEVIERVSLNPDVSIDRLERLLAMQERIITAGAEAEFTAAFSAMQAELPSISERGEILNKFGAMQSRFAKWEDINKAIKPCLAKYGFALSFRMETDQRGVMVTGILSHKAGHRETTCMILPPDVSGNKNAVQSMGSSVSYGKRYTACALLNITSHGEDDDGNGGKDKDELGEAQELIKVLNSASTLEGLVGAWKAGSPRIKKSEAAINLVRSTYRNRLSELKGEEQ